MMITAGIDLGIENVKVVILKNGKVLSRSAASSGGIDRSKSAEKVWLEALKSAGVSASEVQRVVATGQGKLEVRFANQHVVEPVADARAARFLYPRAKAVVDVGADQVRVVTMDDSGNILEVVLNQKCAAGIGIFLKATARRLGMTLEEMGRLSGKPSNNIAVNDTCAVFAELDAVARLYDKTSKTDIVQAINDALSARLNSVLNDKIIPGKDNTVLVGGVAINAGIVGALNKRSGINFLIPEQPEYAGALGAALIAAG
jgi:predicted CoA-substrate-specific enzyme activase